MSTEPNRISAPRATLPSVWNVPYPRNPFFTGRGDLLKHIHAQLQTGQAIALSQPQAISGLGGIGKTHIALEYAYRHAREYEAVFWVLADSRESLTSGYIAIAGLLKLPERHEQDLAVIIEAVKNWLQTHGSWLLILDNADDLALAYAFLPLMFGGHLLLTTRARMVGKRALRLEVDTMTVNTGAFLLLRLIGLVKPGVSLESVATNDIKTAREISAELGGLPLALNQAGAYMEAAHCSLQDYQDRYLRRRAQLLQQRGGVVTDHPEPVATTLSLSFEKVEQQSPEAANLLQLCAFSHPDGIPEEIITRSAAYLGVGKEKKAKGWFISKRQGSVAQSQGRFELNESMRVLSAYALARRNPSDQTLIIHRLVQAVLRDTMDEQTRKFWAESAIKSVNALFPGVEFETWPQCERYLPHAFSCAELVKEENIVFPEAGSLLNRAGWYLSERARYSEAELLIQQGLAIHQRCSEPMQREIADSLSTLGYIYMLQGRFAEAEPAWQQALTIDEAVLGAEDPNVATDMNNLAVLYRAQGKYEQAVLLFQRALSIDEKVYGHLHPNVATNLNNLALLYHHQGKYERAEVLFRRALAIHEQKFGELHPNTAISLNNLAGLYQDQGKYEQAEPLYQRALAIKEQQLGELHPSTAQSLHNLAVLYDSLGKYEQAEPLYQRTLLIREQTLGFSHPLTQNTREWYISLLRKTGRTEEAMALEAAGQLPAEEH